MVKNTKWEVEPEVSKEGVSAIQVKSGKLDFVNIIYGWSDMGTHLESATRKQEKTHGEQCIYT